MQVGFIFCFVLPCLSGLFCSAPCGSAPGRLVVVGGGLKGLLYCGGAAVFGYKLPLVHCDWVLALLTGCYVGGFI